MRHSLFLKGYAKFCSTLFLPKRIIRLQKSVFTFHGKREDVFKKRRRHVFNVFIVFAKN